MKSTLFIWIILLSCSIISCHSAAQKNTGLSGQKPVAKAVVTHKNTGTEAKQHAFMEFVEYNDDGDYFLVLARKSDSLYSFINNESEDRSLLRGDLIDISWRTDSIEIAGDEDVRQQAQMIVSIVKVRDGKVTKFRKHYGKQLKYTWPEDENYTKYYLDKLYSLVEYYIANSKNELLNIHVKNRGELTYSIEQQVRNEKEYIMIGISTVSGHQLNTIQWLYLDQEKNILYEYDLANDKLVRFD